MRARTAGIAGSFLNANLFNEKKISVKETMNVRTTVIVSESILSSTSLKENVAALANPISKTKDRINVNALFMFEVSVEFL